MIKVDVLEETTAWSSSLNKYKCKRRIIQPLQSLTSAHCIYCTRRTKRRLTSCFEQGENSTLNSSKKNRLNEVEAYS